MNTKLTSLILIFTIFNFSLRAQHSTNPISNPNQVEVVENAGTSSAIQQVMLHKELEHSESKTRWITTVKPTFRKEHGLPELRAIKKSKRANKLANYNPQQAEPQARAVTPVIGTNFKANEMRFGTPPDNDMAVSNGGIVVSVNNDLIQYFDENGAFIFGDAWSDFIDDNSLTSSFFDPKIIYDSGSDRFILVVLHGNTAASSQVVVCFSQTNNPMDGWWIYTISGNPNNDNTWLDYPNIGVSNDDLFISGNLFSSGGGGFSGAVIFQLTKQNGYDGNTLNTRTWSNLNNGFTLVPVSYGQQGNYGPNMFLLSNNSFSGSFIRLWSISDNTMGNPQISVSNVPTTPYNVGADAPQQGTNDELSTGDCRIQGAFLLDDYIHFVFASEIGSNGYTGINYNRLNYTLLLNQSEMFGIDGSFDYAYPKVASYSNSSTDKSVMIAFLSSSQNTFPDVRVVNCDDNFVFGQSVQVKAGETFVNFSNNTTSERWGDYNGISRRHNAIAPEIWLAGSYGANLTPAIQHRYITWVSQITDLSSLPQVDFISDTTEGVAPFVVSFTDQSINNPTSWNWSFPGGSPSTSNQQNPLVQYSTPGVYDVSLTAGNSNTMDSETKTAYITVNANGGGNGVAINEVSPLENVSIYPNPVYDLINIKFDAENREIITIKVINQAGQLVKLLYKGTPKQGENMLRFNRNALSTGIYFVTIESESKLLKNEQIIIN